MRACSASTATRMSARRGFAGREDTGVNDSEISQIPFGLFELDARGVVVHFSPVMEEHRDAFAQSIIGRNFFDDLFSISEVEELKSRFLNFMADGASVERFTVSFDYNESSVKVQIVMAHLSEKTEQGHERFALLRMMPDMHAPAPTFAGA
jgi:photoactive yellow protein